MIEDSMSEDLLPYLRLRHLGAADAFLLEAIFRQARAVAAIALGDTTGPARHSAAHNIALSARRTYSANSGAVARTPPATRLGGERARCDRRWDSDMRGGARCSRRVGPGAPPETNIAQL